MAKMWDVGDPQPQAAPDVRPFEQPRTPAFELWIKPINCKIVYNICNRKEIILPILLKIDLSMQTIILIKLVKF